MIVTVFSVSEKFLGFLYRIYMSRAIGAEGVGLYSVAISIFGLIFTVICSGTPITVSRLMTKYKAQNDNIKVNKVITAGIIWTLIIAVPVCLVFMLFPNSFTFLFADQRCLSVFLVLLPGLIFTSVYSVLRGVFWGNKDFLPYSITELLEEICMIVVGIILINSATSVFQGAFRAGVAVLVSYVFSFTLSTIIFFVRKNRLINPIGEFKPLLTSALPVTAMRTVTSLASSIVSIVLPLRLVVAGYSNSEALSLFGSAVGQAIPLLFIPTTLIGSFTLVLIPEISTNYYQKKFALLKNDVEKAIKFTCFLTCLFIPVYFVLGEEIGVLVFDNYECGKYLSVSAFLMLFMGLNNITTSILNSIGQEKKVLFYSIISGVIMLLCIWFLPLVMGIYSLLVGFTFVYGLTTILNVLLIKKFIPNRVRINRFIAYSLAFLLPTSLLGLMLEKLLLSYLGTLWCFMIISGVLILFNALLFVGFNLIDLSFIKSKKTNKKRAIA